MISAFKPTQIKPTQTTPRVARHIRCQANNTNEQSASRRSILNAAGLAVAALLVPFAASTPAAQAFGSGFPGYDMNLDARKRAQERIKREMQADLDKAAAYRAKLAAEKAAKAAAAAASGTASK